MPTRIKSKEEIIIIPAECKERFLPMREPQSQPLHDNGVFLAGISELRGQYLVDRTNTDFNLLLYTSSGRGCLHIEDRAYSLEAGTLFVGPTGTHYRYHPEEGHPWHILWFHIWSSPRWNVLPTESPQIRQAFALPDVEMAVEHMLAESVSGDPTRRKAARLYASLILVYLEREFENELSPAETQLRERIENLWIHVHANVQHDWNIQELAEHVGLSPSHFHRVVLRFTGISPKQMVTNLRMQRAENLLLHHDTPLRVVASLVGYSTPFAFSAAFKRYAGINPREFRRRNGNTASE